MAKKRGRPQTTKQAQDNADLVYLRIGIRKDLDARRGRKPKGQLRIASSLTKQELPEAAKIAKVSPRTLERQYYEHRHESESRIVADLLNRLKARDEANKIKSQMKARADQKAAFSRAASKSPKNK